MQFANDTKRPATAQTASTTMTAFQLVSESVAKINKIKLIVGMSGQL